MRDTLLQSLVISKNNRETEKDQGIQIKVKKLTRIEVPNNSTETAIIPKALLLLKSPAVLKTSVILVGKASIMSS